MSFRLIGWQLAGANLFKYTLNTCFPAFPSLWVFLSCPNRNTHSHKILRDMISKFDGTTCVGIHTQASTASGATVPQMQTWTGGW